MIRVELHWEQGGEDREVYCFMSAIPRAGESIEVEWRSDSKLTRCDRTFTGVVKAVHWTNKDRSGNIVCLWTEGEESEL